MKKWLLLLITTMLFSLTLGMATLALAQTETKTASVASVCFEAESGRVQNGAIVDDMAAFTDRSVKFGEGTAVSFYFDSTEATTYNCVVRVKGTEAGQLTLIANGNHVFGLCCQHGVYVNRSNIHRKQRH